MAVLFDLAKEINKSKDTGLAGLLVQLANQIGLLEQDASSFFKSQPSESELTDEAIEQLIVERKEARNNKDFARSDEIRDLLSAQGIELLDSPTGTTWRKS
jgi:cysteinyl-tRNA synthetase